MAKISPDFDRLSFAEGLKLLEAEEDKAAAKLGEKALLPGYWYKGCPVCSEFYSEGKRYLVTGYGGLLLGVTVGEFEKYVDVHVIAKIKVEEKLRINLLPQNVQLFELLPQLQPLPRAEVKAVEKSIQNGAAWKAVLFGALAGMATETTTITQSGNTNGTYSSQKESGQYSGTYSSTSTVTRPNLEAQRKINQDTQRLSAQANARSRAVRETALLANTIGPGQIVSGHVYFRKERHAKMALLRVLVGTVSLEFPLDLKQN